MTLIPRRLGLQQRMLPFYRVPFFEALAMECEQGLGVFAGLPRADEAVEVRTELEKARFTLAQNHHYLRGPLYACWQSNFLAWLDDWQPEVLIVEANPRYLSTPAALRWMRSRQRPVIGWGLGAPARGNAWDGLRAGRQRRFIQHFDALITYSQQGADDYNRLGFPQERTFVAPNAVTPRPVGECPARGLGFSGGRAVVLSVGRLQARKRIDLLVRACADLSEILQPDLWIVGDGPERETLERLAGQLFPAARFFGAQHGKKLEELFSSADLFILPGTGGLAIQQAMSYGLPVIAAEADGTQNDLVRAENGWCIAPGSQAALQDALQTALGDATGLRKMGLESFRIVQEEINLDKMVQMFSLAVRAVLER